MTSAAADVARYAARRFRDRHGPAGLTGDPLADAINERLLDASIVLLEAKKRTATCIAELQRTWALAEARESTGAEWSRKAESARAAGAQDLAREAQERAAQHEALAAETRARAELLREDVEACKAELLRLESAIERARLAASGLAAAQVVRRARTTLQREVIDVQEALSVMQALAAVGDVVRAQGPAAGVEAPAGQGAR